MRLYLKLISFLLVNTSKMKCGEVFWSRLTYAFIVVVFLCVSLGGGLYLYYEKYINPSTSFQKLKYFK